MVEKTSGAILDRDFGELFLKLEKKKRGPKAGSRKQHSYVAMKSRLILALLESPNLTEAARKIGVNQVTVGNWVEREDLQVDLAKAQERIFSLTMNRILGASRKAVAHLEKVLSPDYEVQRGDSAKTAAAEMILSYGMEICKIRTFVLRLERMEEEQKRFLASQPTPPSPYANLLEGSSMGYQVINEGSTNGQYDRPDGEGTNGAAVGETVGGTSAEIESETDGTSSVNGVPEEEPREYLTLGGDGAGPMADERPPLYE